jgi:hypothetical protein
MTYASEGSNVARDTFDTDLRADHKRVNVSRGDKVSLGGMVCVWIGEMRALHAAQHTSQSMPPGVAIIASVDIS